MYFVYTATFCVGISKKKIVFCTSTLRVCCCKQIVRETCNCLCFHNASRRPKVKSHSKLAWATGDLFSLPKKKYGNNSNWKKFYLFFSDFLCFHPAYSKTFKTMCKFNAEFVLIFLFFFLIPFISFLLLMPFLLLLMLIFCNVTAKRLDDDQWMQVYFCVVGYHFSHVISWMQCAQYSDCNVHQALPHSY